MSACKAVLNVGNAPYLCELHAPHAGIAHYNAEAQAYWCSDGEARRYRQTGIAAVS